MLPEDDSHRFPSLKASYLARLTLWFLCSYFVFSGESSAGAQSPSTKNNWSHWRGPFGNGTTLETSTATHWSTTENIRWQTPMQGPTSATPTLSRNLVITTSLLEDEHLLSAYSTDEGFLVWERTLGVVDQNKKEKASTHSAPSLVSDNEVVVAITKEGDCCCYRLNGQPVWKFNFAKRLSPLGKKASYGSTPFLHKGRLYLQWIHGDGNPQTHESMVACLDTKTGASIWTTARTTGARNQCEQSYASPILIDLGNYEVIVSHGADYAVAHRVTDGHEVWRIGGLNPMSNYRSSSPFVASPVASKSLLVLPAAKNGVVVGLDFSGLNNHSTNRGQSGMKGWRTKDWMNLTGKPKKLWHLSGGSPGTASPLLHEGLLYLCNENGELYCYDARTSEIVYRRWLPKGYYHASPILANEKIYFTSYSGEVSVIKTGRKFEMLAHNYLPGPIVASPIVDRGVIYFRSYQKLFAVEEQTLQPKSELSAVIR